MKDNLNEKQQQFVKSAFQKQGNQKKDTHCVKCGVTGYTTNYFEPTKSRMIENSLCFECDHWTGLIIGKDNKDRVRVDGSHYMIGPENNHPSHCKGFGGAKWKIRFKDGREAETTNLWHQGQIPDIFKDELPDNAEFIHEAKSGGSYV